MGYVSWGEYPHNFAAVLDQEEIFRLIVAKGGNVDLQVEGHLVMNLVNIPDKHFYRIPMDALLSILWLFMITSRCLTWQWNVEQPSTSLTSLVLLHSPWQPTLLEWTCFSTLQALRETFIGSWEILPAQPIHSSKKLCHGTEN